MKKTLNFTIQVEIDDIKESDAEYHINSVTWSINKMVDEFNSEYSGIVATVIQE